MSDGMSHLVHAVSGDPVDDELGAGQELLAERAVVGVAQAVGVAVDGAEGRHRLLLAGGVGEGRTRVSIRGGGDVRDV